MKDDITVQSAIQRGMQPVVVTHDGAKARVTRPVPPEPPVKDDAVRVDVRKDKEPKVYGYDKNGCCPPPVKPDPVVKPPDSDVTNPVFKGLYREEENGETLVALDGIFLRIAKDGSVEGTIFPPKGGPLSGKGTFQDGKMVITFDKIGTYSGNFEFVKGGVGKVADGSVLLSNVQHLAPAAPPLPPAPLKPVHGKVEPVHMPAPKLDEPTASVQGFKGRVSHGGSLGPSVRVKEQDIAALLFSDDEGSAA